MTTVLLLSDCIRASCGHNQVQIMIRDNSIYKLIIIKKKLKKKYFFVNHVTKNIIQSRSASEYIDSLLT